MSRRRVLLAAGAAALAGVLVLTWAALLRPPALGGSTGYIVVVGESMEPALSADDLVVVRRRADYVPGDVIAYRVPGESSGAMVIHRVIGGNAEEGYLTQGDNREGVDVWRPRPSDVVGAQSFHVPAAGVALRWVRAPAGISTVMAAVVFTLVLLGRGSAPPAPVTRRPAPERQPTVLRPRGVPLRAPGRTTVPAGR